MRQGCDAFRCLVVKVAREDGELVDRFDFTITPRGGGGGRTETWYSFNHAEYPALQLNIRFVYKESDKKGQASRRGGVGTRTHV